MRIAVAICAVLALIGQGQAAAQSTGQSSLKLSYQLLKPGQHQTLTVFAKDLTGSALPGASVLATLRYGQLVRHYHLQHTDQTGRTSVTFTVPKALSSTKAAVQVLITNGYLKDALVSHFSVTSAGTTIPPSSSSSILLVANAVPQAVVAPQPIWIAIYAHTKDGKPVSGARVSATAYFREGTGHASATTDSSGTATLRIKTYRALADERVEVSLTASLGTLKGAGSTRFEVGKPLPTPVPTATSTPVPTPAVVPAPLPTSTPTPTAVPAPTLSAAPTATPTPPLNPALPPTPTSTPVPTATNTQVPTPTPSSTPTSLPTVAPTPEANCPGTVSGHDGCIDAMLNILNRDRAQYGAGPLQLDLKQSTGNGGSCPGAYGHSVDMANRGYIFHNDLWGEICYPIGTFHTAGQNVGRYRSGDEMQDLIHIDQMMMSEPHSPGCSGNHACNILSDNYSRVGIGIYVSNGETWLTEDFIG